MEEKTEVTTIEKSAPTQVVKTTKQVESAVQTEHPQKVFAKKKVIFRSYQVVWFLVGIIEVLLGFRVTFLALGADPNSGFVSFIYAITSPFTFPFQGILRSSVAPGGAVFEWSTIIAAVVVLLIGVGLVQLMQFIKPVTPQEVSNSVDTV